LNLFWLLSEGSPLATAGAIGARSNSVSHHNTLEFSNSYE